MGDIGAMTSLKTIIFRIIIPSLWLVCMTLGSYYEGRRRGKLEGVTGTQLFLNQTPVIQHDCLVSFPGPGNSHYCETIFLINADGTDQNLATEFWRARR